MPETEASSHVALLHQISNIVSSNLALERMLEELVRLAVDVTGCDACLVYLADHATGEIVLRASQLPHASEIGSIRMHMGEGITGWVAQHRSVVALGSKASADARFKAFQALPEDTYEAFLSVPLITSGGLIGVINIHHRQPHTHSPGEIALVSFIGEQMGGAIAKSQLAERTALAARRLEALAGLAKTISEESYLDRILHTISEMLAESFDAPVCSISLNGQEYRYPESAPRAGLVTLLSVPLTARDALLGKIDIYTHEKRAYAEDEIGFVKVVAGQAAIAIENARLASETQEMKRTLEIRKLVERAKGILQHKHQLTEAEAYLRLRNESRRLRRPMRELAEAVILADDLEKQSKGA
jgi:GAF domain-containing protein